MSGLLRPVKPIVRKECKRRAAKIEGQEARLIPLG